MKVDILEIDDIWAYYMKGLEESKNGSNAEHIPENECGDERSEVREEGHED